MNRWFSSDENEAQFKNVFDGSVKTEIVAKRVADVIKEIDPDLLAIQEGPSRKDEMELFIETYLEDRYQCEMGSDGGAQKIFVLYKKNTFDHVLRIDTHYNDWEFDKDGDFDLDSINFTRTPLELEVFVKDKRLKVFVVHLKSNFINNGEQLWNNPNTRKDYVKDALINRRRILTEAIALRSRVDNIFDEYSDMLVLGDMNDGPGKHYFEKFLLGLDVTQALLGDVYNPQRIFNVPSTLSNDFTAVFDDFVENIPNRRLLLDRIILSPSLTEFSDNARVEHEAFNKFTSNFNEREGRPSDHVPASISIEY
jgi:endonuclease/exonuclease/phosphatase family metal-dependent hydrolase